MRHWHSGTSGDQLEVVQRFPCVWRLRRISSSSERRCDLSTENVLIFVQSLSRSYVPTADTLIGMSVLALSLKESFAFSTTCALVSLKLPFCLYLPLLEDNIYCRSSMRSTIDMRSSPRVTFQLHQFLVLPPLLSAAFYLQALPSVWISLLASFSAFYGALVMSIITYRLSPAHPLYKYPGTTRRKGLEILDDAHHGEGKDERLRQVAA